MRSQWLRASDDEKRRTENPLRLSQKEAQAAVERWKTSRPEKRTKEKPERIYFEPIQACKEVIWGEERREVGVFERRSRKAIERYVHRPEKKHKTPTDSRIKETNSTRDEIQHEVESFVKKARAKKQHREMMEYHTKYTLFL